MAEADALNNLTKNNLQKKDITTMLKNAISLIFAYWTRPCLEARCNAVCSSSFLASRLAPLSSKIYHESTQKYHHKLNNTKSTEKLVLAVANNLPTKLTHGLKTNNS